MSKKYAIVEATDAELDNFILLLEEVGAWLWAKGVKQWAPGTFYAEQEELRRSVEQGCLILAYDAGRLAGGCILSALNPGWPDDSAEALYLGSLVVARFAAGQGLGHQIVEACTAATLRRGKSLIRLDCWEGNDFLKSFYQEAGFTMLEPLAENDYNVRLFEKVMG